jgi:molecular chaperone DnaK
MVGEAEQHAAEDQRRRNLIEARNAADHLVYQTEKNLSTLNGQAPAQLREQLESKLTELKEAVKGDDVSRIQTLTQELQQASMAIGEAAYQSGPEPNGQNGGSPNASSADGAEDEDIVEGEFESA